MNNARPDYFQPTTPVETILRRIKGNYRRSMVLNAIEQEGVDSIPEPWLAPDLPDEFKSFLGGKRPDLRGGEDLPDLLDGEVEIARMSLVDSVHGEVTSLRARLDDDGSTILLNLVDEYGDLSEEEAKLEESSFSSPGTAEGVLQVFNKSEPCVCVQSCTQRFSSDFYPGLDELADELNIKQVWED